ncbi:aromatic alcohol reductase [Metapseudomonas lalkuanensis]|uniref:Aromatic alcohol reductase n=1 Tax=Metapseudomonas lalkuanensis TaxID=2604832 RepID=A0A5J6QKV6_9GAMM|nr:aromatic alcohol reductase [Pseudomonas lalkuanensis]QEY63043.1 aromatic alcohol reductase [Pseudomonas lalkuanensis]
MNISTKKQKILVLGAGELGIEILRELSRQGIQTGKAEVSVLLRKASIQSKAPEKIQLAMELDALGIDPIAGDVVNDSIGDLAWTFRDYDTIVSCVGFAAGPGTQVKLAKSVLEAGVGKYFPWQFGCDYDVIGRGSAQPLFDEQLDVRDLLRDQRHMDWTIVSTGMFTSFLFEPYFGVVDLANNAVNALGSWDTKLTLTTPQDIGKLTAMLILSPEEADKNVVHVAGDTVTYGQLADLVDSVMGLTVERTEWTVPFLKAELGKAPDDVIKRYRLVFAQGNDHGDGVAWDKGQTFNGQKGIAVTSVEAWMRKNML